MNIQGNKTSNKKGQHELNTQYYTYEDYKTRFDEVFREEAPRNVIVCIGENEDGI